MSTTQEIKRDQVLKVEGGCCGGHDSHSHAAHDHAPAPMVEADEGCACSHDHAAPAKPADAAGDHDHHDHHAHAAAPAPLTAAHVHGAGCAHDAIQTVAPVVDDHDDCPCGHDHAAPAKAAVHVHAAPAAAKAHVHGPSCNHDGHDHAHHDHAHDHPHDDHGHAHVHGESCGHDHGHVEPIAVSAATAAASTVWKVEGMDCGSCANTIRTAVERMPGVSDLRISLTNETLAIVLDTARTPAAAIESQIGKLGYRAVPLVAQAAGTLPVAEAPRAWWRQPKGRLAIASGALVVLAYLADLVVPQHAMLLFSIATLIAVAPIARRAFAAAFAGAPFTIQMLLTIAVAGALVIGAAEEAAVVVFLFCVGEVLEGVAANKARAGIRALGALVPQTAMVEVNGAITEVPAATLAVGQTVLVRPGDRVPADGTVLDGQSSVDESPITGESIPRAKAPGAEVFAGSINHDAALKVRVARAAKDNMIARIVALVEEAQEAKAPTERYIDRFSRVYMPIIVGLAALVCIVPPLMGFGPWTLWLYRGLTLLLIGCPCALVISVPAAIASSLSAAARRGLLIKGGAVVETLATVETVAFDKTGTLTEGKPRVTDIVTLAGTEADLLSAAAAVERGSNHPLALAIVARAEALGAIPSQAEAVKAVAGKGMEGTVDGASLFIGAPRFAAERATLDDKTLDAVARLEGEGKTTIVVVKDAVALGLIALRDEPRADAAAGIAALTAMGVRSVMLTGDNARTGAAVGRLLGMETKAEMLPSDKADVVKAMAAQGRMAMVGDGINDAPALASAHVGIAMGSGTDVALEAADAALLKNRVGDVATLIALSRATMANIRQNIGIALALKVLFLITTVTGVTGLWMAILADTGGTVLVTLNALRLLGYFRKEDAPAATALPRPATA